MLATKPASLTKIGQSRLARQTGWMVVAQGGRVAFQAAYFILIARALDAHGYGMFEAALAVAVILVPFASWGTGQLLVMRVARDRACFPRYWGNVLLTTLVTALPLTLLTLAVGMWLLPVLPLRLLALLAIAQFVFSKLADGSAQAFQAYERMKAAALLTLFPGVCRFAAALLFVAVSTSPTPQAWAVLYLASTIVGAVVAVVAVHRLLGRPVFMPALLKESVKQGGYFSVGAAAESIYADIDKAMLARWAALGDAGIYAAAYRATYMAFTPVRSLLYSTYARFFRQGEHGIRGSLGLARSLLPVALALSGIASLGLWVCAPLVPAVLGADYRGSVAALRWLAVLPIFQSFEYLAGDTLSGANDQGIRSAVQIGVVPLNIGLNLLLIPRFSWEGAAWSTLASEGAVVAGLWTLVWWCCRQRAGAGRP